MPNMWRPLLTPSTYIQRTTETHFYMFSIIKQSLVIFLRYVLVAVGILVVDSIISLTMTLSFLLIHTFWELCYDATQ